MPKFISDAEMNSLEAKKPASPKFISDEQMNQMEAPEEEPGIISRAGHGLLNAVGLGAQALDSVTGAPIRAGIGSYIEGKPLSEVGSRVASQFGRNPEEAPTGKELAARGGLSEKSLSDYLPGAFTQEKGFGLKAKKGGFLDVSPAGVAGLAIDTASDPLNAIPLLGKGARAVSKLSEEATPLGRATKALVQQPAQKALELGKNAGTEVLSRGGEALTGVPKEAIKTYVENLKEINQQAKKYAGDIASASDDVKKGFERQISTKRQEFNAAISKTLNDASPKRNIVIKDVIDTLKKERDKLNPNFKAEDIAQIDEMISKAKEVAQGGKATLSDVFGLKEHLQELAKGSYKKSGQIFIGGKDSSRAAKIAGAEARRILNKAAPEIAEANNQLSLLHGIEEKLNKNILAQGKSEAALIAAGSSNNQQRKQLGRLDKVVGGNFVGEAEKLAAQRYFAKPDIVPVDSTGKSFTRTNAGRILAGAAFGHLTHLPGGELAGIAASSPAALKGLINSGAQGAGLLKRLENPKDLAKYQALMATGRQKNNEKRGLLP